MQTVVQLHSRTGADGVLRLNVSVGIAEADFEVVVVAQPRGGPQRDWLPGFWETLSQGWQGEPLVRSPQGEYEKREPLS